MVQASGRMGERSVQPKEWVTEGAQDGKERESTARRRGPGGFLWPKGGQARRLAHWLKPETDFPATTFTAWRQSRALKQDTYKTHRTGSNSTFLPTSRLLLLASVLEDIIQKAKAVW